MSLSFLSKLINFLVIGLLSPSFIFAVQTEETFTAQGRYETLMKDQASINRLVFSTEGCNSIENMKFLLKHFLPQFTDEQRKNVLQRIVETFRSGCKTLQTSSEPSSAGMSSDSDSRESSAERACSIGLKKQQELTDLQERFQYFVTYIAFKYELVEYVAYLTHRNPEWDPEKNMMFFIMKTLPYLTTVKREQAVQKIVESFLDERDRLTEEGAVDDLNQRLVRFISSVVFTYGRDQSHEDWRFEQLKAVVGNDLIPSGARSKSYMQDLILLKPELLYFNANLSMAMTNAWTFVNRVLEPFFLVSQQIVLIMLEKCL